MINKQNSRPGIWAYIFIFLLIYISKDTLLFGTNSNESYANILYIATPMMILPLLIYGYLHNKAVDSAALLAVIALCGTSLACQFINEEEVNPKYFYACFMYLLAFLVCTTFSVQTFKKIFVDIVTFLAVASLIAFAISYILPNFVYRLPLVINEGGHGYGNMVFAMIPYKRAYVTNRCYGIFREPGVYQCFLNMNLMFLLEQEEHPLKSWKFYISLLALVFTFSTAGYITCMLVILIGVLSKKISVNAKMAIPMILAIAAVVFLFEQGIIKYDTAVFKKLQTRNASTNSRFGSILVDLYMVQFSPIIGNGYIFVEENFPIISSEVFGFIPSSNTNTIMKLFAVQGVIHPVLMVWGIFKFCRNNYYRKFWMLNALVYLLLLSNEDFIFNSAFYIIIFYGFAGKGGTATTHEATAS